MSVTANVEKEKMRKTLGLLAVLLAFALVFTSCSLEEAMNNLAGNKYIEKGWVEFDTSAADTALSDVDNIKAAKPENNVSSGNVDLGDVGGSAEVISAAIKAALGEGTTVTISTDESLATNINTYGVLDVQTPDDRKKSNANIQQALTGANRETYVNGLKEEASTEQSEAAKNTMAVTSAAISVLTEKLSSSTDSTTQELVSVLSNLQSQLDAKSNSDGTLSKAEVLQTQMITNLVTSAATVLSEVEENTTAEQLLKSDSVNSLLDEAVVLTNTSKALAGDVDVLNIDGIGSLLSGIVGGSSSGSESIGASSRNASDVADHADEISGNFFAEFTKGEDGKWTSNETLGHYFGGDLDTANTYAPFIKGALEEIFKVTYTGGKWHIPTSYSSNMNGFQSLLSAYDVMYSVVAPATEISDANAYSSIPKKSAGNALDYIVAAVVTMTDSLAKSDKGLNLSEGLVGTVNEFLADNSWVFAGEFTGNEKIVLSDGLYGALKAKFADSDTGVSKLLGSLKDELTTRAGLLDKMMVIGKFNIMEIFGLKNDDGTTMTFTSFVKSLFNEEA